MNLNKILQKENLANIEIYYFIKKFLKKELQLNKNKKSYQYSFKLLYNSILLLNRMYGIDSNICLLYNLISNNYGEGRAIVNKFMKMPSKNETESKENLDCASYFLENYFNEKCMDYEKTHRLRFYIYKKNLKSINISNNISAFKNIDENYQPILFEDILEDDLYNEPVIMESDMISKDVLKELKIEVHDLNDLFSYIALKGSSKYSFAPNYRKELQNYMNHTASIVSQISEIVEESNRVKFCIENIELYINKGEKIIEKEIDHQWFKISKKVYDKLNFKKGDTICIFGKIDLYKKEVKGIEVKDYKVNPKKIILYK